MPFIPHTQHDTEEILQSLGCSSMNHLLNEIPSHIPRTRLDAIPEGFNEWAATQIF